MFPFFFIIRMSRAFVFNVKCNFDAMFFFQGLNSITIRASHPEATADIRLQNSSVEDSGGRRIPPLPLPSGPYLTPKVVWRSVTIPLTKMMVEAMEPRAGSDAAMHIRGVKRYGMLTVDSTIIR